MTANIYVGPKATPELVQAVREGGGNVVDNARDAEAIVWYGWAPGDFSKHDHDGIRWVQLPSAGVESWFAADVFTDGKMYTSATGTYGKTIAEHALALMLAGARDLHTLARRQTWSSVNSGTLFESTVGIVGAGGIGKALIELLEPFGVRVLAVNRSGRPVPGAALTVTTDRLHDVLAESDYVVIGAPATPETMHLIGRKEFEVMRPNAWLVNIARGSLVDTDALVDALRDGEIAGAGLDVAEPEPLPDGHPLWTEPRALITPHSANPGKLFMKQLAERVRENVRRFLASEPMLGVVDRTHGY